jgi:hypothetical protein
MNCHRIRPRQFFCLQLSVSSQLREQPLAIVLHVERSCPAPCQTPCNACTRTTIAPAAHAICDILATNVGIVRKACRGGGKTHHERSARSRQRAANRRRDQAQGTTLMIHPPPRQGQAVCEWTAYEASTRRASPHCAALMVAQAAQAPSQSASGHLPRPPAACARRPRWTPGVPLPGRT